MPTLDEYMERNIAHRSSADKGTRHRYGQEYRRNWSRQPVEQMGGRLLGSLPVDVITGDMLAAIILRLAERLKRKTLENARGLLASGFQAMVDDPEIPITVSPCRRLAIPVAAAPLAEDEDEEDRHTPGQIRLGQDVGYVGDPTDPTPNNHYTVPGVLAGKPTPKTTAGRCRTPQPCIDEDDQDT